MTREEKKNLEDKINRIWKRIDACEAEGMVVEMSKFLAQLTGMKYVLKELGYTVVCEPDCHTRRIVTLRQYANM